VSVIRITFTDGAVKSRPRSNPEFIAALFPRFAAIVSGAPLAVFLVTTSSYIQVAVERQKARRKRAWATPRRGVFYEFLRCITSLEASGRAFVRVNCAAIPLDLLETDVAEITP
jgi:hypothetical protein